MTPSGDTALIAACRFRRVEVVKALLADERVDPNIADPHLGNTALLVAAWGPSSPSQASIVQALLEDDRVDRRVANKQGQTADQLARGAVEKLFSAAVGSN